MWQAELLWCVAGDPFTPASLDPAVRTATVLGTARAIDAGRTFDRLPILADADAVEEAGATTPACWRTSGAAARTPAGAPRRT